MSICALNRRRKMKNNIKLITEKILDVIKL